MNHWLASPGLHPVSLMYLSNNIDQMTHLWLGDAATAQATFNELERQIPSQARTSEEALYSRLALTTGTSAWTVAAAETIVIGR